MLDLHRGESVLRVPVSGVLMLMVMNVGSVCGASLISDHTLALTQLFSVVPWGSCPDAHIWSQPVNLLPSVLKS